METTLPKKKIITEANIFRGIFCLFVVLIHTSSSATTELRAMSSASIVFSIFNTAIRCAVPAFIFVSGLTLAFSYKDKALSLKPFYLKRCKTTVLPYVFFTIFYYVLYILLYKYEISWSFFLTKLLTGNMAYHLYFMVIIIQFYLVFPAILLLFKKFNPHYLLGLASLLHILCFIFIPMKYRFFGNYLTFFILGCYVAFYYDQVMALLKLGKIKWSLVAVSFFASLYYITELYLERHFHIKLNPSNSSWQIFSLLCIPGYYILSLYLDQTTNKCLSWVRMALTDVSKVSLSIYLGHPFVILGLKLILKDFRLVLKTILMSALLVLFCIIYAKVMPLISKWFWAHVHALKDKVFPAKQNLDV